MNFEKILQSFFNLNLGLRMSFFKKTVFIDEALEEEYMVETGKNSIKKKIYIDGFIIFCYIAILLYVYVHKYQIMFIYIGLGSLAIVLILIAISHKVKSIRFNSVVNHLAIFLLSIFLNFKVIYVGLYLNTQENDNDPEIIRTIIYDFVSKNILCWIALEPKMWVTAVLFLFNLSSVLVSQMKSNTNHFYYFDGVTALIVTLFFYIFQKFLEVAYRAIYSDKYRIEKFYIYTRDFIKGLGGYYLNIANDFSVNCDAKMIALLNEMKIDRSIGVLINFERRNEINQSNETNKIIDVNSFISINNLEQENGKLSGELLNLFTLYNDENCENANLLGRDRKLGENLKKLVLGPSKTFFESIGKYKLESFSCTKYFDVHFRKFSLSNENSINDVMIYDITENITSKQNLIEEVKIRQKIMAKLVHEFKTPINSIIGVIGNIEDSLNNPNIDDNKTTMKHLHTVRNLSNYVIFLISDIIHFTNKKSLEEIKINVENIDLREITDFGFDILNSLLRCNKAKNDSIQPILEFDENIDSLVIKADDVRLKQIILNFVSNAVKFTKAGWIKLKCSIILDRKCVMLSISDTGVGIPAHEKEKLYNDFKMIKNDGINNAMGSGLGLSICKSLATSMNMEISTSSVFGQGSEFSLAIPFETQPSLYKRIVRENLPDLEEDNQIVFKNILIAEDDDVV